MQIEIDSVYSFHRLGQRENQEDARFPDSDNPSPSCCVFAVCDGVGGCDKGEVASAAVCRCIADASAGFNPRSLFSDRDFSRLLAECYDALDSASSPDNVGMGTTLAFLAFHAGGCFAAHIGDSRIYQIRPDDGVMFRSEDHSLVKALVRSGNLSPDKVRDHPKGNVITRCMSASDGVRNRDDASVANLSDIAPGDYFLLCSDGVSNCFDDDELVDLLSANIPDSDKVIRLADLCSAGPDNNTAILIHVGMISVDADEVLASDVDDSRDVPVKTMQLPRRDSSVHDVEADKISKVKSFFYKFFK